MQYVNKLTYLIPFCSSFCFTFLEVNKIIFHSSFTSLLIMLYRNNKKLWNLYSKKRSISNLVVVNVSDYYSTG
ncbi:hypothetical protein QE152_g35858 [Popillia japonica]|uniref:Uncharacterized protein n=1 Tax=Popillia japonica TaxID=7064 RepID=A0AAW1IEF9_POPJA